MVSQGQGERGVERGITGSGGERGITSSGRKRKQQRRRREKNITGRLEFSVCVLYMRRSPGRPEAETDSVSRGEAQTNNTCSSRNFLAVVAAAEEPQRFSGGVDSPVMSAQFRLGVLMVRTVKLRSWSYCSSLKRTRNPRRTPLIWSSEGG